MQNPAAFQRCGGCGAPLAATRSRETRKTVTIVFADLKATRATAEPLAPNVLKDVLARAFEASHRAVERHGGTLAKFIGDAVMAVFGLAVRREDATNRSRWTSCCDPPRTRGGRSLPPRVELAGRSA